MRKLKIIFSLLLLVSLIPCSSFADELDEECATFCSDNGYSDGHYLAPEPGSNCQDDYEQNPQHPICCCKK